MRAEPIPTKSVARRSVWIFSAVVLSLAAVALVSAAPSAAQTNPPASGDWVVAEQWARLAQVLVVTEGSAGCTVFARGRGARQLAAPLQAEVSRRPFPRVSTEKTFSTPSRSEVK